jgi:plastocyanin
VKNIKPSKLLVGVSVLVLTASFIGLYLYGSQGTSKAIKPVSQPANECNVRACISLKEGSAEPTLVTVEAGSDVQFNSSDGKMHNLSLVHSGIQHHDESRYESGDFGANEAWKVQFKQDGSFTFHDKYNDKIQVSVVVYTPGKDYKIQ